MKGLLTLSGNEHFGHRQRLKQRFLNEGNFEGFEDHVILEMLLFYSIPQKDTNPLAHRLINRFGSLYEVFDASFDDLMKVDGISYNTAVFIKSLVPFGDAYMRDKYKRQNIYFDSTETALRFFTDKHQDFTEEAFSIACLDAKNKLLSFDIITKGSIDTVMTDNRETVRRIIENRAVCAMVCHNHPSGIAIPSGSDIKTTEQLIALMRGFGVRLLDHIIVAGKDAVSMRESAFYCEIFYKYS